MRILFCDDDPHFLALIQEYVLEFFQNFYNMRPECAVFSSGDALLSSAAMPQADIAFLDVEMPGVSGIQAGAQLKKRNPYIKIFMITAYPDYLDEAMRFEVFRYLSKPVDKARLFRNLKDAMYQYSMETREFAIATKTGVTTCRAEELVCVVAQGRTVTAITTSEHLICTEPLAYWQQQLTLPCFFCPHRSYIINMRYVSRFTRDTIVLKYGSQEVTTYLTRRKYTQFKDTYLMYLESLK